MKWKIGSSFYRGHHLSLHSSYHHLLEPAASAAATRPLLLAAGLYGASSLAIPPPIPPPCPPIPGIASLTGGYDHENRRSASNGGGGPLDLSHLTSASAHQPPTSEAGGGNGGGGGGKIPRPTSMHSILGLQKSAGNKLLFTLRTFKKLLYLSYLSPLFCQKFTELVLISVLM